MQNGHKRPNPKTDSVDKSFDILLLMLKPASLTSLMDHMYGKISFGLPDWGCVQRKVEV